MSVACCNFCLKPNERLLTCGRCKVATYCNAECQKSHWKAFHCNVCLPPKGKLHVKTFGEKDNYAGVVLLGNEPAKKCDVLFDGSPDIYFSSVMSENEFFSPPGVVVFPKNIQPFVWMEQEYAKRFPAAYKRLNARGKIAYDKNGVPQTNFASYLFENNVLVGDHRADHVFGYMFDEFLGKINHACHSYNCEWVILPNRCVLIARRDIEPGEEITIAYSSIAPLDYLFEERAYDSLGFKCRCKDHGKNLLHCPYKNNFLTPSMEKNIYAEIAKRPGDDVFEFLATHLANAKHPDVGLAKRCLDAAVKLNLPSIVDLLFNYIDLLLVGDAGFLKAFAEFVQYMGKHVFGLKNGAIATDVFMQQVMYLGQYRKFNLQFLQQALLGGLRLN